MSYPPVAYICLAWKPMLTYRTIIECEKQSYPGRKVLYLMHQRIDGIWPFQVEHDLSIEIKFHYVEGTWPVLWFDKFNRALRVIREDICLVFDEDDMYETDYTIKAVTPILEGKADATGNPHMKFVQMPDGFRPPLTKGMIKNGKYDSIFGTIAGKRSVLLQALIDTKKRFPARHKRNRPIDGPFRRILRSRLGARYRNHGGLKYYFFHNQANTFITSGLRFGNKHRLDHGG